MHPLHLLGLFVEEMNALVSDGDEPFLLYLDGQGRLHISLTISTILNRFGEATYWPVHKMEIRG